jgi:1-acyl-sn-glycerol-3-phosphate acyltransferase
VRVTPTPAPTCSLTSPGSRPRREAIAETVGAPDRVVGIKRIVGTLVIKLFRFTIVGEPPRDPLCVMVAAPHTSNWDFILALAIAWAKETDVAWLGKQEMFTRPTGWLFRKLGGVSVDRENPGGLVQEMIDLAGSGRRMVILIPVEGTRKKSTHWTSGFRRIAQGADLPVVLSFLDRPTRTGGFGPTLRMTDDVRADMDAIRAFYADKHGLKPGQFTPPRLCEEDAAPG